MGKYYISLLIILVLTGCATYKAKYVDLGNINDIPTSKEVSHTFYLIGDAGLSPMDGMNPALTLLKDR